MKNPLAEQPWRTLFFSTLICSFLSLAFMVTVGVRFFDEEWVLSAWIPSATFTAYFGSTVVIHYRIQDSSRFRRTVFSAAVLGASAAWYFGMEQMRRGFPEEGFEPGMVMILLSVFSGCMFGFFVLFGMRRRAKYLLSGVTNNWLQSYATKMRLVDPAGSLTELSWKVGDVLQQLRPAQNRFLFSFYAPLLFLDTDHDGEHCFCLQKVVLYCIRRPPVFFSIDWDQVEEIQERHGEFRKTRFISPLSSQGYYTDFP